MQLRKLNKQPVAAVFIRSPSGGITRNLKRPKSDRLLNKETLRVETLC